MDESELERLRMLEQRMRRPSKIHHHNEDSFKTIKSTDSKKVFQNAPIQEGQENSSNYKEPTEEQINIRLS